MYCRECGAEIPEDSKFCTACGHAVATAQTAVSPEDAATQEEGSSNTAQPEESMLPPEEESETVPSGAQLEDASVEAPADGEVGVVEDPALAAGASASAAKEPLPANARWGIFAAAMALAVVIGVGAPLAMALTDENSILNGNRTAQSAQEGQDAAVSSNQAASSSSESSSSAASSASSSASSSAAAASSSTLIGTTEDEYILPQSSTHLYTAEELAALTDYELYLARNEVFARYGREFKNADLTEYFSGKDWYVPRYDPATFDAMPSPLNDIERDNMNLIREIEAQHNSPYAA